MKTFLAVLCAITLLTFTPACSTVNKAAYKTTIATSATADIGLHVWADYVAQKKATGDPVPLAQELQAKKAWNSFQDARDLVIKAGLAYSQAKSAGGDATGPTAELNAAVAAMGAASADFLALLQSFGVKVQ